MCYISKKLKSQQLGEEPLVFQLPLSTTPELELHGFNLSQEGSASNYVELLINIIGWVYGPCSSNQPYKDAWTSFNSELSTMLEKAKKGGDNERANNMSSPDPLRTKGSEGTNESESKEHFPDAPGGPSF